MKALTIWQPWASLIIAGAKPYEFRGWRAPRSMIGQRIVIHAAAHKIDRDEAIQLWTILMDRDCSEILGIDAGDLAEAAAETCLIPERAIPILQRVIMSRIEPLPMACGLGTALLGEPRIGTDIAEEFGVPRANDSDRDEHANWGWPLTDIEVWPEPIPMRGAQGFWNWPTAEQEFPA